ncbi:MULTISPECIES: sporulation protein YqfC [Paenibacillus]|jgi:sporulation protein YqfC|uniref:Sporulation protein YqfC n=2 Tax=Paenibacillus TaxID=44249 RepID=A0AAJ3IUJ0_PAEPO|nr:MULTISPECIES: sporulation protein YqfC [Paenibacillus]AIW40816.1 sporulation protein YqfC [Paenibacillus polymyxa CR1]APB70437.1 sporulation protein YqfC [Paenibacillus polymyxa]APB75105.1 sporulation protein YqfC [Paenibacillus polymyxa]APQ60368.1 sporulation protein YqfC [Paenibacillus polymyxa]MBP1177322.1 sporulation protein YqfC [Paenibacillus sp. PvR133]
MSRMSRKLRKWASETLELPQDILFDLPRLTLIGSRQLYVENHRGVVDFTPNQLVLALEKGRLRVSGHDLVITSILPEQVSVEGHITDIQMEGTEEGS